jgi:hypothetical protein
MASAQSRADNEARVADEVAALSEIYGQENVSFLPATSALSITLPAQSTTLSLSCILPPGLYPSLSRPRNPTLRVASLSAAQAGEVVRDALEDCCHSGEELSECLFQYCSGISEACDIALARKPVSTRTLETAESQVAAVAWHDVGSPVFHGETLIDRKSAFQAHAAHAGTVDDALTFVSRLRASFPKLRSATHSIMAYRVGGAQDSDDDGEYGAGRGLLFTLQQMNVDSIVVVVSRWFGGTDSAQPFSRRAFLVKRRRIRFLKANSSHVSQSIAGNAGTKLGPIRFKHINNVARSLLEAHPPPLPPTQKAS